MILERPLLRKCVLKPWLLIKRQLRCTYIMCATYEKLMILESDLLRKSLIRFSLLLKDRSFAPISWVLHISKYILESHLLYISLTRKWNSLKHLQQNLMILHVFSNKHSSFNMQDEKK